VEKSTAPAAEEPQPLDSRNDAPLAGEADEAAKPQSADEVAASKPAAEPEPALSMPTTWKQKSGCILTWVQAFAALDPERTGVITLAQLEAHLVEASKLTSEQAKKIVSFTDDNKSGCIEVAEFVKCMLRGQVTPEMVQEFSELPQDLTKLTLRSMDANGDGTLSAEEIGRFFTTLGLKLRDGAVPGKLTYGEFGSFLAGFSEEALV
jgi:Ca2+-binding EF-hand superfamily protein